MKEQQEAVEKMVRNGGVKAAELTVTPKSLNRVIPPYIFLLCLKLLKNTERVSCFTTRMLFYYPEANINESL